MSDNCSSTSRSAKSGAKRSTWPLDIEKCGFAGALHHDIEDVSPVVNSTREERRATLRWHKGQNRIQRVRRLVGEIDACDEPRQDAPRHHADENVRCLFPLSGVGYAPRLDCVETVA